MQIGHTKFGHGAQDPAQHLRARESEHHIEAMARRGSLMQLNMKLHPIGIHLQHNSLTPKPPKAPHTHCITHLDLEQMAQMISTVIPQYNAIRTDPILVA
jgi:hypothetical protein